jgi:hypothetical protein
MILIDNVHVSDEVIKEQFVCDLDKCKGGCCVDGDAGAPLAYTELEIIDKVYPIIEKYLSPEAKAEIAKVDKYRQDEEFDWVTPDINGGLCVYGYTDEKGIVKCAFEKAYYAGEISWKKPISCHLYPIRIEKTDLFDVLHYEPREVLCAPACINGKKLKVPVYQFLKEPIIRKYGQDFFNALETIAGMGNKKK